MADKIIFKTLMLKGDAGEPTAEQTQVAVDSYMQSHPEAAIDETIINSAVGAWLDDHPEATTTVQDGSLTEAKFSDALKLKTIKDYVTPQMFGAKAQLMTALHFHKPLQVVRPYMFLLEHINCLKL